MDFNDYFSLVLAAVFCGVLHHAINGAIYEELQKKEESERRLLDELQKEIYQKEQEQFERSLNTTKERIHQQRIKEK